MDIGEELGHRMVGLESSRAAAQEAAPKLLRALLRCPSGPALTQILTLSAREEGILFVETEGAAEIAVVCDWPKADHALHPANNWYEELKGIDAPIVVLEAPDPLTRRYERAQIDSWNERLKAQADSLGAHFVPLRSKFLRWGPERCLERDFMPNRRGSKAIARAIAKIVLREGATAAVSDRDVTLTCAQTGQSLRELLERDPAAADNVTERICSPAAIVCPDYFWRAPSAASLPVSDEQVSSARALLSGEILFPAKFDWPPVPLSDEKGINWSQTGSDRSWQSLFLGLDFLVEPLNVVWPLLAAEPPPAGNASVVSRGAEGIDGKALLVKAIGVLSSFSEQNPPHAPVTPRAWHEGTASRRLRTLFALLSCCHRAREVELSPPLGALTRVTLEIARTANLLASEETYLEGGNHGVRQDYGLYAISRTLMGAVESDDWRALALRRLAERQCAKGFSRDGVWLEHSTGYHGLVMNYLITAERVAAETGDSSASDFLTRQIQAMLPFFAASLLPDGRFIAIGDTAPDADNGLLERAAKYEATSRVITSGIGMFPDAGYMLCHPAEAEQAKGVHVAFYANLKSSKHKQADDLAIFLQEGRTPWLIDGGAMNKQTSDRRRNAARFDPGAHNTYRVNGAGYSFNRQTADKVGFLAGYVREDWCGACAVNRLYKGGEVLRFVVYVPGRRLVVVLDRLASADKSPAIFEQFWHLAPGTEVAAYEGGFLARQPGHPTQLLISVDQRSDDAWDEWEGSDSQPIGWTMTALNRVTPNPVLRRSMTVKRRWCVTAFCLRNDSRMPIIAEGIGDSDSRRSLVLQLPGGSFRIRADMRASLDVELIQ